MVVEVFYIEIFTISDILDIFYAALISTLYGTQHQIQTANKFSHLFFPLYSSPHILDIFFFLRVCAYPCGRVASTHLRKLHVEETRKRNENIEISFAFTGYQL
jgi:hypothetical protein